ncbi:hypothetical protein CROQUDRAFT_652943 [Cronartium quercuum f. sp. fusiforme G11]|uniref:PHD-type domain-containing protein n=1 Tax=Cronartium quercuum f. sp. fusiforme G11 TaxID=708437 RepID=A0A9P6NMP6_9BASI|nr:hypothetical protein CROQUDRAFT_652943 [Cronartium quercuum f. sp. fusiforme G11]
MEAAVTFRNSELPAQEPTMTRSTRIRKPSQKAKEIAEAIQPSKSPSPSSSKPARVNRSAAKLKTVSKPKKRKSTITVTAKVKAGGKKGRAVVDKDGGVQIEEVDVQQPMNEPDEADDALYCICLGHDDHTPMIQCEECENWFHFACIQLDPSEASVIQAFYCDVCEASGSGKTHISTQHYFGLIS